MEMLWLDQHGKMWFSSQQKNCATFFLEWCTIVQLLKYVRITFDVKCKMKVYRASKRVIFRALHLQLCWYYSFLYVIMSSGMHFVCYLGLSYFMDSRWYLFSMSSYVLYSQHGLWHLIKYFKLKSCIMCSTICYNSIQKKTVTVYLILYKPKF